MLVEKILEYYIEWGKKMWSFLLLKCLLVKSVLADQNNFKQFLHLLPTFITEIEAFTLTIPMYCN